MLALDLTVAMPSGASTVMAMERDPSLGVGAFRSARDMECDLAGRYWTDVRITTVAADGHRLDVFRDPLVGILRGVRSGEDMHGSRGRGAAGCRYADALAEGRGGFAGRSCRDHRMGWVFEEPNRDRRVFLVIASTIK